MRLMYSGASWTAGVNVHSASALTSALAAARRALSCCVAASADSRAMYVSGSERTRKRPSAFWLF